MATSNIQESGLENSIFFLEPSSYEDFGDDEVFEGMSEEQVNESLNEQFRDDMEHNLPDELDEAGRDQIISVYDHEYKQWQELSFTIRIASCYYSWANLIIICDDELDDLDLSSSWQKKVDAVIRKLEKICRQYSTEIKCVWRFSNWEAFYEKI